MCTTLVITIILVGIVLGIGPIALDRKSVRLLRDAARTLANRAESEAGALDQVVLVIEDFIRVEPERAESLAVARLELMRHRDNIREGAAALTRLAGGA
jgi:hypothetical protein